MEAQFARTPRLLDLGREPLRVAFAFARPVEDMSADRKKRGVCELR